MAWIGGLEDTKPGLPEDRLGKNMPNSNGLPNTQKIEAPPKKNDHPRLRGTSLRWTSKKGLLGQLSLEGCLSQAQAPRQLGELLGTDPLPPPPPPNES